MIELAGVRVDVEFPLVGERIPLDHGYALFGAICRVLGDLHGAKWLSVHPVRGIPLPGKTLALQAGEAALRLRIDPAELPAVLPLAGQRLNVGDHAVRVGVPTVHALQGSETLRARLVVIKGFQEPEPFAEAVRRQLDALNVKARIEVGRRRVLDVAGDRVVGFGVKLSGLTDQDSMKVQRAGVGGRQRMGCGVFVPSRGITTERKPRAPKDAKGES